MTRWPSVKAQKLLSALISIGLIIKRQSGSHRTLSRPGYQDFVFAFHDGEEIRTQHAHQNSEAYWFGAK